MSKPSVLCVLRASNPGWTIGQGEIDRLPVYVRYNFAEASASISYLFPHQETGSPKDWKFTSTGYNSASVRHNEGDLMKLIREVTR